MQQNLENDQKWISGIESIKTYLQKNNWNVIFRHRNKFFSCTHPGEKTIYINSRHSPMTKYYILLHELGHSLEMSSYRYVSPAAMYCIKTQPLLYKIERIKEEIAAWDKGGQFANEHDLPLDCNFDKVRARYLKTYIDWDIDK